MKKLYTQIMTAKGFYDFQSKSLYGLEETKNMVSAMNDWMSAAASYEEIYDIIENKLEKLYGKNK